VTADTATQLLVIRHGQTDWNAQARIQGHTDIPLNAEGRTQAARLAEALRGQVLAAVYSSDLRRASETAQAVAGATGAALSAHPGLRERALGRFEGLAFGDIEQRWPDDAARWRRRDLGFAPVGGESLQDFHTRCVATTLQLAARHPDQVIALVAHGGVLDCLYRAAVRVPLEAPRTWVLGNATINRLRCRRGGLALVDWDDDTHLREVGPAGAG
jgi:probable phosphoglycerate mutase